MQRRGAAKADLPAESSVRVVLYTLGSPGKSPENEQDFDVGTAPFWVRSLPLLWFLFVGLSAVV